jgi:deoxyribonuclease V
MPRPGGLVHRWDLGYAEARTLQDQLAERLVLEPIDLDAIGTVAGVDLAYPRAAGQGVAAVVVLSYPGLEAMESATQRAAAPFPYIPGLLAFREAPVFLGAYERLFGTPDVLVVDGHGVAHPRGLGIASHIGLLVDRPTVGCAKSVLVGEHEPVGEEVGATAPLVYRRRTVGMAVRTRAGVKPVYVSCGHLVDLESAVRLVLACTRGYRLPEPTRRADRLAAEAKRAG